MQWGKMADEPMPIGKIIAWLEKEDRERLKAFLEKPTHDKLCLLIDRFFELDKKDHYSLEIPEVSCSSEHVLLEGNPLFFFFHFLRSYAADLNNKKTHQLVKHLNDCYHCFHAYSAVFRDYYLTLSSYSQGAHDE